MSNANANDRVRTLIVWETPATGSNAFVEMYVNPEAISITDAKITQTQRTKGGYILQYWGEELTEVTLNGTTGAGGVEALNVLHDIYRSEQITLQKIIASRDASVKRRQSLAQLATSVVMWYQGKGYRGFFKNFRSDEATSGMFKYNIAFTAVETIGTRKNFMPWHRKPWSTLENPSFDGGRGQAVGGAYGTNYKIGELNAPALNEAAGLLSDPQFTKDTGVTPDQNTLRDNLAENNESISPSSLFANT